MKFLFCPRVLNLFQLLNTLTKLVLRKNLKPMAENLRLMWHYRNQEREIIINPFKKKSKFNPKRKDAAIEIYFSRLEEDIFALDKKLSY